MTVAVNVAAVLLLASMFLALVSVWAMAAAVAAALAIVEWDIYARRQARNRHPSTPRR